MAANLAEAGHRVLLLEAGLDPEDDDYRVPAFHGRASESPGMSWPFFVRHYDDDAQQRARRQVPARAGRRPVPALGHPRRLHRAQRDDHGRTRTTPTGTASPRLTGDRSWRAPAMRRWFERLEACGYMRAAADAARRHWLARLLARLPLLSDRYVNRGRHGFDGWLHTSLADPELALGDSRGASR